MALALGSMLVAGCARHEAEPAFRRSVLIGDRGISVPLPPPSLFDAPKQSVDVVVEIHGEGQLSAGIELNIVDNEGELDQTVVLADGEAGLTLEGLPLDLTMNCLELWLTDGDVEGEHSLFRAVIGDDAQTIETVQGCE